MKSSLTQQQPQVKCTDSIVQYNLLLFREMCRGTKYFMLSEHSFAWGCIEYQVADGGTVVSGLVAGYDAVRTCGGAKLLHHTFGS